MRICLNGFSEHCRTIDYLPHSIKSSDGFIFQFEWLKHQSEWRFASCTQCLNNKFIFIFIYFFNYITAVHMTQCLLIHSLLPLTGVQDSDQLKANSLISLSQRSSWDRRSKRSLYRALEVLTHSACRQMEKEKQSISALMNAKQPQFNLSETGQGSRSYRFTQWSLSLCAFTNCASQLNSLTRSSFCCHIIGNICRAALPCEWYTPLQAPGWSVRGHHTR